MKNKTNNTKTKFYLFGLLMLYFILATYSCKKETKPTEIIIPTPTPRRTPQIQTFTLDTTLKSTYAWDFDWEPWDDYAIKNGEDSLFYMTLPPLDSSIHYNVENFTDVSLIMKNGDTIKSIPALTSMLNIPSPFSFGCSCELYLQDRVNYPNYIQINWIQTVPFTRPNLNAVRISLNCWSWK